MFFFSFPTLQGHLSGLLYPLGDLPTLPVPESYSLILHQLKRFPSVKFILSLLY